MKALKLLFVLWQSLRKNTPRIANIYAQNRLIHWIKRFFYVSSVLMRTLFCAAALTSQSLRVVRVEEYHEID